MELDVEDKEDNDDNNEQVLGKKVPEVRIQGPETEVSSFLEKPRTIIRKFSCPSGIPYTIEEDKKVSGSEKKPPIFFVGSQNGDLSTASTSQSKSRRVRKVAIPLLNARAAAALAAAASTVCIF